jgi:hypothetical protein
MVDQSTERRAFARIEINTPVEYRLEGQGNGGEGLLDNMSANGFLLWTEQDILPGSRVYITVKSDTDEEVPIQLTAVVIRINDEKRELRFGYGCQLEETFTL